MMILAIHVLNDDNLRHKPLFMNEELELYMILLSCFFSFWREGHVKPVLPIEHSCVYARNLLDLSWKY